jgi:hypothetical protein
MREEKMRSSERRVHEESRRKSSSHRYALMPGDFTICHEKSVPFQAKKFLIVVTMKKTEANEQQLVNHCAFLRQ